MLTHDLIQHVTYRDVDWHVASPYLDATPAYRFWDDWDAGLFEPYTLDTVERFVTPGSTVVDVGAWLGPVSLWASHLGARVVAVEPDPLAAEFLRTNVAMNNCNVEVFEGAVSDETGTCFIQANDQGWASSMTRVADDGDEVPCLTLPDLFDIYDIDDCALVKVDVEGHEAIILERAAPFLASLKIPILVAMHQPWWSQPVDPAWFDGYSEIEGEFAGWGQVLAVP